MENDEILKKLAIWDCLAGIVTLGISWFFYAILIRLKFRFISVIIIAFGSWFSMQNNEKKLLGYCHILEMCIRSPVDYLSISIQHNHINEDFLPCDLFEKVNVYCL